MFYVKNVQGWERVLRVVLGLIVAAGIVASGLVGFCPMCAMVGRRLDKAAKQGK